MPQGPGQGYQAGSEPMWWWKVALHLDEAQRALANAMAHNVDDPGPIPVLHDRLREGQAILLEIFRAKGLLPGSGMSNGTDPVEVPMPAMPAMPEHEAPDVVVILTAAALAGVPVPSIAADVVVVAGTTETMTEESPHPIDAAWNSPAVSEEDQAAVAVSEHDQAAVAVSKHDQAAVAVSEHERSAMTPSPNPVVPVIVPEVSTATPPPDPTTTP